MKSAKELKKLFDQWERIDSLYCGEKTDWREVHSKLWALEAKVNEVVIRNDDNAMFCAFIKRKLLDDIRSEKLRVGKMDWK